MNLWRSAGKMAAGSGVWAPKASIKQAGNIRFPTHLHRNLRRRIIIMPTIMCFRNSGRMISRRAADLQLHSRRILTMTG